MTECTRLLYLHEDALGQELKLISHFKLPKRNANTTGSSQLCSCHNSFLHDCLHKTFCSRLGGALTTPPLFHAPLVNGTRDAFSPHFSKSYPPSSPAASPKTLDCSSLLGFLPLGTLGGTLKSLVLVLHWHCNVSSRSAWAFK